MQLLAVGWNWPRHRMHAVFKVLHGYLYPNCCHCLWWCCCYALWAWATTLTVPADGWRCCSAPDFQHRWRGTYRPAGPLCAGLTSKSEVRKERRKAHLHKIKEFGTVPPHGLTGKICFAVFIFVIFGVKSTQLLHHTLSVCFKLSSLYNQHTHTGAILLLCTPISQTLHAQHGFFVAWIQQDAGKTFLVSYCSYWAEVM